MKIATTILRILLGLVYTIFSLAYFFDLTPQQEMEGPVVQFMTGLDAARYLMPIVKSFELLCGIALLSGRFVPLATVVIFPITLNILLFHFYLMPAGSALPIVMMIANLFLAYRNLDNYKMLLTVR